MQNVQSEEPIPLNNEEALASLNEFLINDAKNDVLINKKYPGYEYNHKEKKFCPDTSVTQTTDETTSTTGITSKKVNPELIVTIESSDLNTRFLASTVEPDCYNGPLSTGITLEPEGSRIIPNQRLGTTSTPTEQINYGSSGYGVTNFLYNCVAYIAGGVANVGYVLYGSVVGYGPAVDTVNFETGSLATTSESNSDVIYAETYLEI